MTAETVIETGYARAAGEAVRRSPSKEYVLPAIDRVAQAAREQAHVDWRVRYGTLAYGVFEGSGITTAYRDGRNIQIDVEAQEPVPLKSMVLHGDFKEGEPIEMVTPLLRII